MTIQSNTSIESVKKTAAVYQKTAAEISHVEGFGFWTGQDVRVEFRPASENSGIRFIRTDIPGSAPIPAQVQYRLKKPRQTSLACNGAQVDMVEHLLAAVRGMNIDNLEIRVNGPEMPGFDGSSLPFLRVLQQAGTVEQKALRRPLIVRQHHRFGNDRQWIEIGPSSTGYSTFRYEIEYQQGTIPHPIPNQSFETVLNSQQFAAAIAPARTFLLKSEAQELLNLGLCRRVTERDVLVFGPEGVIGNTLRFANEPARHKVLDMIGDFSLSAYPIIASFRAFRTGHQQNADALSELLDLFHSDEH